MQNSVIAWTDHTFNIAWGCREVSPGCQHCYAKVLAKKYGTDSWGNSPRRTFGEKYWKQPLMWNRTAREENRTIRVFTSSMCDVFEDHPTIERERIKLWDLIRATPSLTWQVLTKRADRIERSLPHDWGEGYTNTWLGVSVENLDYLERVRHLVKIPARIRFISYEPALGPLGDVDLSGVHWLIYGGESGKDYRPSDLQWARDIRDRCRDHGVAFFFKQSAAYRTESGIHLDGKIVREFP